MVKKGKQKENIGKKVLLWLVVLVLKVLGLAFIVQGFVKQSDAGVLYWGMAHYAVGLILMMAGWSIKMKWLQKA